MTTAPTLSQAPPPSRKWCSSGHPKLIRPGSRRAPSMIAEKRPSHTEVGKERRSNGPPSRRNLVRQGGGGKNNSPFFFFFFLIPSLFFFKYLLFYLTTPS